MSSIPDFNDTELKVVKDTLNERYRRDIEIERGDAEIRLYPGDQDLTMCPVVYWKADEAGFVIVKTGEERYRSQFFYRVHQQYGTGVEEFDNIGDCIVTLLQVQADHEGKKNLK